VDHIVAAALVTATIATATNAVDHVVTDDETMNIIATIITTTIIMTIMLTITT
jgi:hypothetical protein